jgi:hypothetical protein
MSDIEGTLYKFTGTASRDACRLISQNQHFMAGEGAMQEESGRTFHRPK